MRKKNKTQKTVNGVVTNYYWLDNLLVGEETEGNIKLYMYDSNGSPIGMQYHAASYAEGVWDTYWYEKNIFGDVVGIYGEDGTKIVSYTYTAYGVSKKTVIGFAGVAADNLNPFLYRGYYYDSDIGLYYLQTRYYDPVKCRFISPDKPAYLGANGDLTSYNLYAYCSNNPVKRMAIGGAMESSYAIEVINGDGLGLNNIPSSLANFGKDVFQIPIWIPTLLAGSEFGASVSPALQTIYLYIRYPILKDLNTLYGLDLVPGKIHSLCRAIGWGLLGVNIGLSAISNFTDNNLTTQQKWIGFGVDSTYALGTFGVGFGTGALVSALVPGGVFIAPLVSALATWLIDKSNESWGWVNGIKHWLNDF